MNAIEFLKVKNRICKNSDCYTCILGNEEGGCQAGAECNMRMPEEQIVEKVEKWASKHTIKTRLSELLKIFPNASINKYGCVSICPVDVDKKENCGARCGARCMECQKEYWLEEVE